MCGITGLIRYDSKVEVSEIKAMTDAIKHRGPDGEGFHIKNNIAIGHRRLSIIDLDGGKQPMCDDIEKVWITFNGEIYNYKELKKELEEFGYTFKTNSDTEVIIHSYKKWGKKCVNHLRGMFAFCIVDYEKNELFIARDPYGIKPLVYIKNNKYFAFASEIKALKQIKDFDNKINLESIDFFLRYQYIPSPNSIFNSVKKLKAGHYKTISFEGETSKPIKYWEFKFAPKNSLNYDEWKEKTKKAINESVKSHLISDVPFGVFLSGGIDSTLIGLNMRQKLSSPIKAFTIGFEEKKYSELKYAQKAAKKIGLDLVYDIVNEKHYSDVEKIICQYDEPFGDFSCVPTFYVSKLAREHVPMVLSGDGPDELFGGYRRYNGWNMNTPSNRIKHDIKNLNLINATKRCFRYSHSKIFNGDFRSIDDWWEYIYFTNDDTRKKLWNKKFKSLVKVKNMTFEEIRKNGKNLNHFEFAQNLDINSYLKDDILTKVDIASMSNGLEVRPPFLDKKFAELAMNTPTLYKLKNNEGKYILKDILSDSFEKEFVYRNKMGFGIPKDVWFAEGGFLRKKLLEYMDDDKNKIYDIFSQNKIRSIIENHSLSNDLSNEIWLIFVLLIWFKNNKEVTF